MALVIGLAVGNKGHRAHSALPGVHAGLLRSERYDHSTSGAIANDKVVANRLGEKIPAAASVTTAGTLFARHKYRHSSTKRPYLRCTSLGFSRFHAI
jgi:hypothetical protein